MRMRLFSQLKTWDQTTSYLSCLSSPKRVPEEFSTDTVLRAIQAVKTLVAELGEKFEVRKM